MQDWPPVYVWHHLVAASLRVLRPFLVAQKSSLATFSPHCWPSSPGTNSFIHDGERFHSLLILSCSSIVLSMSSAEATALCSIYHNAFSSLELLQSQDHTCWVGNHMPAALEVRLSLPGGRPWLPCSSRIHQCIWLADIFVVEIIC